MWAPYYKLLPEKENYESNFMKSINYPRISRKMDELGNVKCKFGMFSYERDLAIQYITDKCMDDTGERFPWLDFPNGCRVCPGLEKYEFKYMHAYGLLSYIFNNLMD